ncbi:unnamed protein product [Hymenolepis diminuta]|uniref:1-acyl-sn-glycerol-3-phosphate acyltransferase n=1 Tax=Hymenolepis diminuta TaxID=6216 RepID=A0A564XW81_HYMDI|nr:unnamed protein product [Hymenolepis diminuta]
MYILYIIAALLLLFLIPKTRPHVRYFVGYVSFGLIVMTGAAVYSVIFFLQGKPRYENSCTFTKIYKLARSSMGLHPRVYGLETFDKDRQYIYVCNHQSFIDVLTLSDVWRYPSTVIAKNSLKYLGPLGAILYFTKVILIHRGDHAKALSEMNRAAEIIRNDKVNLFMFPEGTRNHNGVMLPFKKGAFHLAIQTQLPIQPVVISCYNSFLDHKNFSFDPVPYGVYLLPPIETKGMDESQVNELIEKTHSAMREVFDLTAKAPREDVGKDLRTKAK